ncbi:TrkH family potassium uptake protein [Mangrovibacillus cuniculi]|uniref:TrkH family potassium uptake protein n=1 Tax=Mangrovibacillus cuniculi TaxID=2593652 RepID=A0A7S8C9Y5_9BACI|nr:TrkH family potassium uptake protein [Mangrovibacillus cuniculi]QPC46126.1 TrkH family potassium uptake protein [Mangrovibacillus cuniculi]
MFDKWKLILRKFTPTQIIVLYYGLAVTVSTLLLSLPIAHLPGVDVKAVDILFTAMSAVSVTGLTTISIVDTFSVTGYFFILFILQFGGIGIMTLGTFFWLILGKKIGLKERQLIMKDQNQSTLSGMVGMLKQILVLIVVIEAAGAIILGLWFTQYYESVSEAFLHGLFASVSATTNGGLDITGESLIPYANDYFVQFITILLIILGAIGFPVLIEVKEYLQNKKEYFRFSLFAKLTSITFGILLLIGTIGLIALESGFYFQGKKWHEIFFYAFFQSTTTRSGGLVTMDLSQFQEPTLLFMAAMMFIGASPSSVGGGIRTTTFALNCLFLYHFARGNKTIKILKREIVPEDSLKALAVTMIALFIFFSAVFILIITEDFPLTAIIFEVASAFGTCGASVGITPLLSTTGKFIIMILMFIGRIGILTFLFIIGGKETRDHYHYPKERVIIG